MGDNIDNKIIENTVIYQFKVKSMVLSTLTYQWLMYYNKSMFISCLRYCYVMLPCPQSEFTSEIVFFVKDRFLSIHVV